MTQPSSELPSDPLRRNEGVTPIQPGSSSQQGVEGQYPTKPFGPYMEQEGAPQTTTSQAAQGKTPSPMELAAQEGGQTSGKVTPQQIAQQGTQILQASASASQLLQKNYSKLSDGQKSLTRTKLSKYQKQSGKAAAALGLPSGSSEEEEEVREKMEEHDQGDSELVSFLSMITTGDTSIRQVTKQMSEAPEGSLNPVDLLKAQAALQSASKSVNFASAVIGQGMSFFKTLMQTQI